MQALLAVVAILLFAVAVFAFQNPDAVTVRFLYWQLSASVAASGFWKAKTATANRRIATTARSACID